MNAILTEHYAVENQYKTPKAIKYFNVKNSNNFDIKITIISIYASLKGNYKSILKKTT